MYEMRVRPYLNEKEKIDGAVLAFIDIADLKKHEEELRREEEKYRTLAEKLARCYRKIRQKPTLQLHKLSHRGTHRITTQGLHRENKQGYRVTRKNFRTINHSCEKGFPNWSERKRRI